MSLTQTQLPPAAPQPPATDPDLFVGDDVDHDLIAAQTSVDASTLPNQTPGPGSLATDERINRPNQPGSLEPPATEQPINTPDNPASPSVFDTVRSWFNPEPQPLATNNAPPTTSFDDPTPNSVTPTLGQPPQSDTIPTVNPEDAPNAQQTITSLSVLDTVRNWFNPASTPDTNIDRSVPPTAAQPAIDTPPNPNTVASESPTPVTEVDRLAPPAIDGNDTNTVVSDAQPFTPEPPPEPITITTTVDESYIDSDGNLTAAGADIVGALAGEQPLASDYAVLSGFLPAETAVDELETTVPRATREGDTLIVREDVSTEPEATPASESEPVVTRSSRSPATTDVPTQPATTNTTDRTVVERVINTAQSAISSIGSALGSLFSGSNTNNTRTTSERRDVFGPDDDDNDGNTVRENNQRPATTTPTATQSNESSAQPTQPVTDATVVVQSDTSTSERDTAITATPTTNPPSSVDAENTTETITTVLEVIDIRPDAAQPQVIVAATQVDEAGESISRQIRTVPLDAPLVVDSPDPEAPAIIYQPTLTNQETVVFTDQTSQETHTVSRGDQVVTERTEVPVRTNERRNETVGSLSTEVVNTDSYTAQASPTGVQSYEGNELTEAPEPDTTPGFLTRLWRSLTNVFRDEPETTPKIEPVSNFFPATNP